MFLRKSPLKELTPAETHALLEAGSILLVDVREPAEFNAARIPGAVLHPLSTFDPAALPSPDQRRVVFHCGSGKRSATAVARCLERGIAHDTHMEGGIQAWMRARLPTQP